MDRALGSDTLGHGSDKGGLSGRTRTPPYKGVHLSELPVERVGSTHAFVRRHCLPGLGAARRCQCHHAIASDWLQKTVHDKAH